MVVYEINNLNLKKVSSSKRWKWCFRRTDHVLTQRKWFFFTSISGFKRASRLISMSCRSVAFFNSIRFSSNQLLKVPSAGLFSAKLIIIWANVLKNCRRFSRYIYYYIIKASHRNNFGCYIHNYLIDCTWPVWQK